MSRRLVSLWREKRGAAALEFAVAVPVLVLILIGIAQLGILFMANAGLRNAVAEGARLATIWPRPTETEIRNRVVGSRFGLDSARMQTPVLTYGVTDGANYVDIRMSYDVPLDFLFFSVGPIRLTESRRVYIH